MSGKVGSLGVETLDRGETQEVRFRDRAAAWIMKGPDLGTR